MNKLISTILIMTMFAGNAFSATLSADNLKSDIQNVILNDYSKKTTAELDIKVVMLPFQSLTLPDGEISYKLTNNTEELVLTSREVKRIDILVNGELKRTLNVPIEVKAYEEVLVATDLIGREQPISMSKVRFKKINIADKTNYVVTRNHLKAEMVAKKDFRDGEYIDKRFIKVRPDVVKNSEVRIILNSDNGFQISIDGIAKNDGTIGEYITVENKMYNKTYTAKVIGENKVQVNI